jgi:hypothetical protein
MHVADGQPVVSVDAKKKELVGRYANGGAEWRPAGEPERVGCTTSRRTARQGDSLRVYDLGAGWVSVGTDHDTGAFVLATLRRWWQQAGRALYPTADRLLVTVDAGGSNGYGSGRGRPSWPGSRPIPAYR